ncbi:MAG TPA: hypothetical protein VGQ37_11085 [Vicinamibacterales bacterium]|jgi:hypothetical protein|nr:hypothetical protein [Vicinamibacterales bacterium]
MSTRLVPVLTATLLLVAAASQAQQPAKFTAPRTPWGDPDLQGSYSNKDENGTPFERPADLAGKSMADFGDKEMAALRKARQARAQAGAGRIGGSEEEDTGAGPSHWYEHLDANNAQPWFVFEPADGQIPALTAEARQRAATRQAARRGRGPADSWTDRSLYDRCITRGIPGSMMPAIYGNAYDITQGPGFAAIRYEMIHETRVIPLGTRAHLPASMHTYTGDARGHWEGDTLVVETTNFMDANAYRGASSKLKMTERFTLVGPNTIKWEARFDDPSTWEKPWAFTMPLKRDTEDGGLFEYACHEGNRGLHNILSAARAEEAKK